MKTLARPTNPAQHQQLVLVCLQVTDGFLITLRQGKTVPLARQVCIVGRRMIIQDAEIV
jgi:hypothetical protein